MAEGLYRRNSGNMDFFCECRLAKRAGRGQHREIRNRLKRKKMSFMPMLGSLHRLRRTQQFAMLAFDSTFELEKDCVILRILYLFTYILCVFRCSVFVIVLDLYGSFALF